MNKIIGCLFIVFVFGMTALFLVIPETDVKPEQETIVLTENYSHLTHNIYVDDAGNYFAAVENREGVIYIEKVKPMVFEFMMKYDVSYQKAKQMVYD